MTVATVDMLKGWCPGALRPMPAGDGLIVRVRPKLSRFSKTQLTRLADIAEAFGDGVIHLTNRANIQVRSVQHPDLPALLDALMNAELLDDDPGIEAVRNIIVSPAIALDLAATEVARAGQSLVLAIEAALRGGPLRGLPGKFGTSIVSLSEFAPPYVSDITFVVVADGVTVVIGADETIALRARTVEDAAACFAALGFEFTRLRQADPDLRRMRDAVNRHGVRTVAHAASQFGEWEPFDKTRAAASISSRMPVGNQTGAYGIGFPFGEVASGVLCSVGEAMNGCGALWAAITPYRSLVVPTADRTSPVVRLARDIGGIVDPNDLRLRLHACSGAPCCANATVEARLDAKLVLSQLPPTVQGTIHVSGCEKRCAFAGRADITAVGVEGLYRVARGGGSPHLVSRDNLARVIAKLAERSI